MCQALKSLQSLRSLVQERASEQLPAALLRKPLTRPEMSKVIKIAMLITEKRQIIGMLKAAILGASLVIFLLNKWPAKC